MGPVLISAHAKPTQREIMNRQYLNMMANFIIDDKIEELQ